MSHRDLQEDIGLELPFAGNMIAEGHERTDGSDRPTIATPSQLDHTTWLMTNNSQPGRWFESLQGVGLNDVCNRPEQSFRLSKRAPGNIHDCRCQLSKTIRCQPVDVPI